MIGQSWEYGVVFHSAHWEPRIKVPVFITLVLPQPIQSLSINQMSTASCHGNSKDGQGEFGFEPIDVEEYSPLQRGAKWVPNNESTLNWSISKLSFFLGGL